MRSIHQLQNWYSRHCDGVWEHTHGLKIDTLDNPGWSMDIDLDGTELMGRPMKRIERIGTGDWVVCEVNEGHFRAFGGVGNLGEMLEVFLSWAE